MTEQNYYYLKKRIPIDDRFPCACLADICIDSAAIIPLTDTSKNIQNDNRQFNNQRLLKKGTIVPKIDYVFMLKIETPLSQISDQAVISVKGFC